MHLLLLLLPRIHSRLAGLQRAQVGDQALLIHYSATNYRTIWQVSKL